jgi:xylulokinase
LILKQEYFLGLDLSTQSLTASLINPINREVVMHSLSFDRFFSEYSSRNGVIRGEDPLVVHADPKLWIQAVDALFTWLKNKHFSSHIRAISVSAQQHGTVYLNQSSQPAIAKMDASRPMADQLADIFSRKTSPVWMDSSTSSECDEITRALNGDSKMIEMTGSIATERFAGPQIRKYWKEAGDDYHQTHHITLISSFITSLLVGFIAPIDLGDGLGTNLANIHLKNWDAKALEATAPGLSRKLPPLLKKDIVIGKVSGYLIQRYQFNPDTDVINGSGDNPSSLAGLGLLGNPLYHAISMGTSDTYFGYIPRLRKKARKTGHIFGTADGRYMFLICFKNGSLARDHFKKTYHLDWETFSNILLKTPPGNNGKIMLAHLLPEITPRILSPGIHRFGGLNPDDPESNVRAVAEGQVMAYYLHSIRIGTRPDKIFVTAGASENKGMLNIIAQVFQTSVSTLRIKESAALGAAFRAAYASMISRGMKITWDDLFDAFLKDSTVELFHPDKSIAKIYHGVHGLLQAYEACEKYVVGLGGLPDREIESFQKTYVR